jgi:hypothetical protein
MGLKGTERRVPLAYDCAKPLERTTNLTRRRNR